MDIKKTLIIIGLLLGCNVANFGIDMVIKGNYLIGILSIVIGMTLYGRLYSKIEVKE